MTQQESGAAHVPTFLHLQSRFFAATRKLWRRLGDFESSILREALAEVAIDKPVYVAGLARSGTTILTEMLERHPDLTSHHYSDFPNVWTPYWRNYLLQRTRRGELRPEERAHKDRIFITNDSPEAVEEVLWMNFFPNSHAGSESGLLDGRTSNPDFESFYLDHLRKLLLVRGKPRYLAKGNYNVGRFLYILKLLPDARFLIPFRNPVDHIASLVKQHRFFLKSQEEDKRIALQLALAGHYEFGPRRRAFNFGDARQHQEITEAWADGSEVEGWARYWAGTYRFLVDQFQTHRRFAQASRFICYEDLCLQSGLTIDRIISHCGLDPEPFTGTREFYCRHLNIPDYYRPEFTAREISTIEKICEPVLTELRTVTA